MTATKNTQVKKAAQPKLARRLVLCLDGTWNTDDSEEVTNIVAIRDSIKSEGDDGVPQIVFYDWGVGTGLTLDRIFGGAVGSGLDQKVRGAYRFLSANYQHDKHGTTEICIFGFSRGAYTARALAGYLGASGLLRPEHCNAENEGKAWQYYRTTPADRMPADRIAFQHLLFPDVRIRCLAVFDTVGAMGIPMHNFNKLNRLKYELHGTDLSDNVDVALHALAVDEKRYAFPPAVWAKPLRPPRVVEQVWFPGVHSNVGGGYADNKLSQIALYWMMGRVKANEIKLGFNDPPMPKDKDALEGEIPESRTLPMFWPDRIWPAFRKIVNCKPDTLGRWRPVGLLPHGRIFSEYLHWTCLYRWRKYHDSPRAKRYAPPNLELAIDRVRRSYFPADGDADAGPLLYVVGKFGEILKPDNDSERDQVYRWLMGEEASN